jgi:replication factor A1
MEMMNKEEIAPHVKEIARVLEGKVKEQDIEKDLDNYLNVYRMSLEASKRHIVRKYGGDPNSLTKGERKLLSQLGLSEQSVDLLVRVMSSSTREVTVSGSPKTILSGIMADENGGTVKFTVWDVSKADLKAGENYLIRYAYTKEWNGQPEVHLGNRVVVELRPQDEVQVPEGMAVPEVGGGYSAPIVAKVSELRENMNNVTLTACILSMKSREVETPTGKKAMYTGIMADETGKVEFTAWHDFDLKEGEVVTITNAYVKGWKGIPRLSFGEKAQVSRPKVKFPSQQELSQASKKTIAELERSGGAADVVVHGTVVDIKKGTGLIFRCPECNRVVQKGVCQVHGKVHQVPDLRIKLVVDDGSSAMTAVMKKDVTEGLTGVTLKEALDEARETMDPEFVGRRFEELLLAKPVELRGNVISDDYGLSMNVSEAKIVFQDVKTEAEVLLSKIEVNL